MKLARVAAGAGLLAALAVLSTGGLRSQDKDRQAPAPKAVKGLPDYWARLDLTGAQPAEVAKLIAEYGAKGL
jgi:hypothetical protein